LDEALSVEEISKLEDSKYFVSRSVDALNLQVRRINEYNASDSCEFWEQVADIHFYIVALRRFRRAVSVGASITKLKPEIDNALTIFDKEAGFTKKMRDIIEHIDDYISNSPKRHHKDITNSTLYTIHFKKGAFCWADSEFNVNTIQQAAYRLYESYCAVIKREFNIYSLANKKNDQRST